MGSDSQATATATNGTKNDVRTIRTVQRREIRLILHEALLSRKVDGTGIHDASLRLTQPEAESSPVAQRLLAARRAGAAYELTKLWPR